MKKFSKSCLFIVLILGILCVAAVAVVVIKDVCPPAGPWPAPPWCDGSEVPFVVDPGEIVGLIPNPLSLTVSVPENTPDHTVVYVEVYTPAGDAIYNTALVKSGSYEWTLNDVMLYTLLKQSGTLNYRYNRNNFGFTGAEEFQTDSEGTFRTMSADGELEIHDTIRNWRWMPEAGTVLPEFAATTEPFVTRVDGEVFQKGVLFSDWWWPAFEPLLASTNARLQEKSVTWVQLAPPWDYSQVNPTPVLSNQFTHAYPDDKLRLHLDSLRQAGLLIFFQPQICCTSVEDAEFTPEWWDAWYQQYESFLLYHADLANEYDIPYFVIGGYYFVVEMKPEGYRERLEAVFAEVDAHYDGKLGMLLYLGGDLEYGTYPLYPTPEDIPYMDQVDFIGLSFWAGLCDNPDPTMAELDANVETIFQNRLDPLYEQYGVPIVLSSIGYPSVDGGLIGAVNIYDPTTEMWQPYASKYQLDLVEQAMGFDAILRAAARHDYIIGTYPFYYLPDTYPLTVEYNIRDKPAEEVLSQWYESIP